MLPELKVGPLPSDQAHLYIQPLPPRVQDDSVQLSSDNQPLARIYEVPVTAISETAHPLWRHRLSLVLGKRLNYISERVALIIHHF